MNPTFPDENSRTCSDDDVTGWANCPDGSHLEVRVVGDPANPANDQFSATATCLPTIGPRDPVWTDAEIRLATKSRILESPKGYRVQVFVAFVAPGTAQVQARVVTPNGTQHLHSYCREITDPAGNGTPQLAATLMPVTVR
jgi:hypothetical protein